MDPNDLAVYCEGRKIFNRQPVNMYKRKWVEHSATMDSCSGYRLVCELVRPCNKFIGFQKYIHV